MCLLNLSGGGGHSRRTAAAKQSFSLSFHSLLSSAPKPKRNLEQMRGIALLRNARIQNANDVVNLAFGYASEEDRLELKKKFVPGLLSFPFSDDVSPPPKSKPKRRSAKLSFKKSFQ